MLLLSVGHDLPYLTGYQAMPLERLTMLVVPARRRGDARRAPARGAAGGRARPGVFDAPRLGRDRRPDGDRRRAWPARPRGRASATRPGPGSSSSCCRTARGTTFRRAVEVSARCGCARTRPRSPRSRRRRRRRPGRRQLHAGEIPLVGRTEAEVSADIAARLVAEGHERSTSRSSPPATNAASPHHHAGDRVIQRRRDRAVRLRRHDGRLLQRHHPLRVHSASRRAEVAEAYAVLHEAQQAAVAAGVVGTPCEDVDRAAARIIADAGYGDYFIHRTGHGIGHRGARGSLHRRGNEHSAGGRPRVQHRARDLPAGAVGHAPGGHRRRHRRRPRCRSTTPTTTSSRVDALGYCFDRLRSLAPRSLRQSSFDERLRRTRCAGGGEQARLVAPRRRRTVARPPTGDGDRSNDATFPVTALPARVVDGVVGVVGRRPAAYSARRRRPSTPSS